MYVGLLEQWLEELKNEVQNQLGKNTKVLQIYRGGEYLSQQFDDHPKECEIISQLTPPRTLQWNGVLRKEESNFVGYGSIHDESFRPFTLFLGTCFANNSFSLNRVSLKAIQVTTYEIWIGKRPSVSFMNICSCKAY
ncbi:hypothetical protein CR513_58841, partial [Mucuna pruriens]